MKTHIYYYSHFKHEGNEFRGRKKLPKTISKKTRTGPSCLSIMLRHEVSLKLELSPSFTASQKDPHFMVFGHQNSGSATAWNRIRILCELFEGL